MKSLWLFATLILAAAAPARAAARAFPHPDRIRYDGQCLTIDGRDTFIFSGSFHYFRCPKELWRDRFRRIKEAGCNAVETYVPWNASEPRAPRGLDDFSGVDLQDLRDWLRMAHDEFGFYTIVRPGPYICAEWDGGGFPRWLLALKPAGAKSPWLRSDDPVFLDWSRHWMKAVCPVIAEQLLTRRKPGTGGVILVQIENEFDLDRSVPAAERPAHLRALYETAIAGGIDVPIFSCWTKQCRDSEDPELGQVFDAFNAYPRFKLEDTAKHLAELEAAQPDAPPMISELQGGWFGKVGGLLSEDQPGLTPAQLNAHTLLAIGGGATILNYYMIFGGTNFARWGARGQTTSYDYDAPIRESGGVGEKYGAVAAIGGMLRRYGPELARARALPGPIQTGSPEVDASARQARDGAIFLFLRNRSLKAPHRGRAALWREKEGEIGVDYELAPFGAKVLRLPAGAEDTAKGTWLPQPAPAPARPVTLPAPLRIAVAETVTDPAARAGYEPERTIPVAAGELLPELGIDDARTVLYDADFELAEDQAARAPVLAVRVYSDDRVLVAAGAEVRAVPKSGELPLGSLVHAGSNHLRLLYLQKGQANFGKTLGDEAGLASVVLRCGKGAAAEEIRPARLTLEPGLAGDLDCGVFPAGPSESVTLDTSHLPEVKRSAPAELAQAARPELARWYRFEFATPATPAGEWIPWRLLIDASGDGELFVNGHALGRYWEVGPQGAFYLPECWLRPSGNNVVTLLLIPGRSAAALRAVAVAPDPEAAELLHQH